MKINKIFRFFTFTIFLCSYLTGIYLLLDFERKENFYLNCIVCFVSLTLFLLSQIIFITDENTG